MKLLLPSGLGASLEVAAARTQTLPARARPEGALVDSWRSLSSHLKMQAQMIVRQDMEVQIAAGREPSGRVPPDAKELLARSNTYELCAMELAEALGIRR